MTVPLYRLAPEENVCEAIQTYISLHSPLDRLPHPVFKCLLLLLAVCHSYIPNCMHMDMYKYLNCQLSENKIKTEEFQKLCLMSSAICAVDRALYHWCTHSLEM